MKITKKQITIFIAGLVIGYLINYKPAPSWESQQLILTPRNGIISPQANLPLITEDEPEGKQEEIITDIEDDEIDISIIRRLESSNGTAGLAVTCKQKGLSNEYGYNPPQCYESHAKLTSIVKAWFDRRSNLSMANQLCYYNTGYKLDDCEYYQKYLSMKGGE